MDCWNEQEYQLLVKKIYSMAEEEYRNFHQKLISEVNNLLGVRVPKLRTLAKDIVKTDWRGYLLAAQDDTYEEVMLQGMVIGCAKGDAEEILQAVAHFVPKINNWAVCDVFCAGLKMTAKNQERVFSFLQPYLQSDKEFEVRFAIVMLMDYFINDTYIDRVISILDAVRQEQYYVKMAVAWAVSVCYVKYPQKTMHYLKENRLDDWTYNKSLQKIIESYRVSAQDKELLRTMKRKG